jgi:hypothetical protein
MFASTDPITTKKKQQQQQQQQKSSETSVPSGLKANPVAVSLSSGVDDDAEDEESDEFEQ